MKKLQPKVLMPNQKHVLDTLQEQQSFDEKDDGSGQNFDSFSEEAKSVIEE